MALLYSIIAGRDPLDSTTAELPGPVAPAEGERSAACASGCRRELIEAEGIEPGVRGGGRAGDRTRRGARAPRSATCSLPRSVEYGIAVLLPDRARARLRPTSRATTASATGRESRTTSYQRDGRADARRRASATR